MGLPVSLIEIPDEIITSVIPLKHIKMDTAVMDTDMVGTITDGHATPPQKDPVFSPKDIKKAIASGQDGDALLYSKMFKGLYLYDKQTGCWYYWNDHHWREDVIDQALASVSKIIEPYEIEFERVKKEKAEAVRRGTLQEAKKLEARETEIRKRMTSLHTLPYKINVLKLAAAGVHSLATPGDAWDSNPMLLGVRNGCVDLKTGAFRDGQPEDFIKTVAPTRWEGLNLVPKAWINFLHGVFDGDVDTIAYVQRLLGYAITGLTYENIYPILWGEHGQNGKGTMIETIMNILGENMVRKLSSEFIMLRGMQKTSGSPDAELYSLRGARIAFCSETNKNEKINVNKIKELSGTDTIAARPPYAKKPIYFKPTHLIFILTNMRPQMPADDNALWLRTHLIPFHFSFVKNPVQPWERKRDEKLIQKFSDEAPAILAWLVRGCLEWQKQGLNPPEKLVAATQAYRDSEDIFQDFIDTYLYNDGVSFFVRKDLFAFYRTWCDENGYGRKNIKHFYEDLERKIGKHERIAGQRGHRGYCIVTNG